MRKKIIREAYYRKNKSTVAHFDMDCHYMKMMIQHETKWHVSADKPQGCTLCDTCQHLERQKRKAK